MSSSRCIQPSSRLGYKSQLSTDAYEDARQAALGFAGREGRDDVAVICRNTTEALNHLAYSLRLCPDDIVVTSVAEHHSNLCRGPAWRRALRRVPADGPSPQPMSWPNWTGPPAATAHHHRCLKYHRVATADRRDHRCLSQPGDPSRRGCRQLAPHRPLPKWRFHRLERTQDVRTVRCGSIIGPRDTFADGETGFWSAAARQLVELAACVGTNADREEAVFTERGRGGGVARSDRTLAEMGWPAIIAHDRRIGRMLRTAWRGIPGVRSSAGPSYRHLACCDFTVDGLSHGLVAARCAEDGIGGATWLLCAHLT